MKWALAVDAKLSYYGETVTVQDRIFLTQDLIL